MMYGESYEMLYQHPDVQAIADLQSTLPSFRVACITDCWRAGLGVAEARNWTFAPGYAWAYGLETADGYLVLYSHRYKEFWSQVLAGLFDVDSWAYQKHEYWGNMVFFGNRPIPTTNAPFEDLYNLDLLSLANVRYIISPTPLKDPRLKLLPSELRDELIDWQDRHSAARIAGIFKGQWCWEPLYIYENCDVLPRFNFVGSLRVCDSKTATLTALGATNSHRFLSEAVLNRDDLNGLDPAHFQGAAGEVKLVSQTSDDLELDVHCDGAGMVVIANTYSPNWQAEVDGRATNVLPADYTFQGIAVETGTHRVHLHYHGAATWSAVWENLMQKLRHATTAQPASIGSAAANPQSLATSH